MLSKRPQELRYIYKINIAPNLEECYCQLHHHALTNNTKKKLNQLNHHFSHENNETKLKRQQRGMNCSSQYLAIIRIVLWNAPILNGIDRTISLQTRYNFLSQNYSRNKSVNRFYFLYTIWKVRRCNQQQRRFLELDGSAWKVMQLILSLSIKLVVNNPFEWCNSVTSERKEK